MKDAFKLAECLLASLRDLHSKEGSKALMIIPLLYERGRFKHKVQCNTASHSFHTFLYKATLKTGLMWESQIGLRKKQQNEGRGGHRGVNILQLWLNFRKTNTFILRGKKQKKNKSRFFFTPATSSSWSNITDMEMLCKPITLLLSLLSISSWMTCGRSPLKWLERSGWRWGPVSKQKGRGLRLVFNRKSTKYDCS